MSIGVMLILVPFSEKFLCGLGLGTREQEAGSRKQKSGSRNQEAEIRKQKSGSRKQEIGSWIAYFGIISCKISSLLVNYNYFY